MANKKKCNKRSIPSSLRSNPATRLMWKRWLEDSPSLNKRLVLNREINATTDRLSSTAKYIRSIDNSLLGLYMSESLYITANRLTCAWAEFNAKRYKRTK